jgi:hypothetical protein
VPEGELICTARLVDISASGVGLLMDRPMEPETLLAVDLQNEDSSLVCSLLVEVRHSRAREEGDWLVGCAFARELRAGELKALL